MKKMYLGFLTIICLFFSSVSNAQINYALNLNGTSQNVISSSIGSTVTDKTYAAWVRLNDVNQGGGGLVTLETTDGSTFDAIVYNETGNGWGFGSNGWARTVWSGVKETSTSTWVHIAATYSNNNYKLYRNGTLIASTTSFGITSMPSTSRILVGKRHTSGGNAFLNASIDEVSVWNRALSQSEIQNMSTYFITPSSNGLLAYYKFDEGTGSTANSSSTYLSGVNGSLVSSPSWVSSGVSLSNLCPSISAAIYGTTSLCNGYTTILNTYITGGTSPYTIVYSGGTINNYVSGNNIFVSPSSTTTYTLTSVTDANGCTATVSGSAVVTIKNPTISTTTTSACDSLWWNGVKRTTSGTYTWGGTNAVGCDSTATLNLTITNSSTSSTSVTSCDSLRWNGTKYTASGIYTYSTTNAVGCDSTATLNLTITNSSTSSTSVTSCDSLVWNGTTYTTSGTYTYSTTNAVGCDSTATLNLTITNSSISSTSVTSCDSLVWNGTTYTTSGTYTYSTTNAVGCDSTATLNLTITNSSTSSTSVTSCDSLVWNGTTYTTSGTYTWGGTNAVGCDSTATLNLTINNSSISSTSVTACDSLVWNGTKYTSSGTYTYSSTNAVGCDSTATLNLTINSSTTSLETVTVCDSLIWNGTIYRNTGTYTAHFTNAVGCDSTATLSLTVNYKPTVDSIVGLTNIEILAIGAGGGAGGPDGAVGAGGGAGGAVYGQYTLPANGSNIYTVGVGGAGGYGQGCAGNAAGGTAGVNGGGTGGNAGNGGCSGGGGGGGGWSGFYQGSTYYVVAGGGAGGGGSNEGTANDVTTPGGGNQTTANGTSMTGQNGTAYSGDGGGGGAGGGGFYGGAGQTNLTTSGIGNGGQNYANSTNRNAYATYVGNSGATASTGTGGQGTTSTITNSSNFNYSNTYGKGGNAQGNGGTATTANGNNGVVIIRYQGSPVAIGGTVSQSGGYTLHTFTTPGANTFRANSASAVCVGSSTYLSCATQNGVWSSSDTAIATINTSTGVVTGITPGVVTITYTVTNAQGCVGTRTKQFTVNPLPTVPAITGTTTICDNTTTTLSNSLTGGIWSSSLTAKATVNASTGLVAGVAAGTSTITYLYTDNNGCSNTNSTVVTVNASPTVAAITGNAGVCIGSTTTFSNVTLNGTWTSATPAAATINSSGLITTVAVGSSIISYTVINASACTTIVTKSITVNALPNVTANATATTVCYGTPTTLTGGNASSYTWNNGVTNGVAFAPAATNTYTVTGTDGNGCVKTANITVTVNSLPIVSISPSVTTICNGYSSTLTASGASTYGWTIVGSTPYLDQVSSTSTLKLAAGLHKLRSAYSGSAIRIRRSSDNAEQDFGFNGNDLDVASISTFIGAGTAYVKTLYDQSGNGNHLSQTSTGNQPTLTLNGLNGKPVIHTNTAQNIYTTTNFPAPFSVVYAARQTGGSRGRVLNSVSNNWLLGWWGGNKGMAHFDGWITNSCCNTPNNNMYVYTGTGTGASSSFAYENKVSITTNPGGGNNGPNGLAFNRGEASDADFTDVVEFNSVLSTTDRNVIENGMGAYYGLSGFYNTTGAVATVYPNTTTNYTVYGTDGNGCIGTATQAITVNPKPNAGADITNACGGSTQTLTGTANRGTWAALSTNPSGSTLSSTTSGVAAVSFVNEASGTYSFIYTLPTTDCSDTMNIVVGAKPNAGSDISSICGGNIISLSGTPNTGNWSGMSTNPSGGSLSSVSANLLARYDASVTSSFAQTSGVVTTWNDLSGNGYHLTQSSSGPTLTTINGVQAFDFNSAKRMTNASVPLTQNLTVLMTIKYNSGIATWGNFMCHGSHDADWSMRHNSDGSNSVGFHTNNDNTTVLSSLTNGNTYILVGRLTQNGNGTNNVEYWAYDLNGSLVTRNATFSTTISAGNKAMFVGTSDNAGEPSNGKIGEILYYNTSLSSNDLTNAVNYLKDKWFNGGGGTLTTTGGAVTINYPNASTGTYNYIYTTPFGCTDTMSVFVTPKPNAGADVNYVCGGATQVLNGTTTNGIWTAMSNNPTGASLGSTTTGSASVTFDNLASGTYNFIYTLPTNCSDTMSITVRPKPNAGVDQAVCILNVATGVTLTSNVTGVWSAQSGNAGTSNIVSANTASTQVNNFSVIGDYNYINTNNGCTDTVKVTVTPAGSIGNYVWKDQNNDGLQNEPTSNGVNGITVELYKKDGAGVFTYYATTTTANDGSSNPGYYNFGICEDGVYKIKVPTVNPFTQTHLTALDATAASDGNSDVNPSDGFSPEVTIDTHGNGVAKDNNTIDAGYQICTKPIAGADFNTCGGQFITITGVSTTPALPTTDGNWAALSSNPSGAILSATNLGVATIQFDSLADGIYKFVYTVTGGCDDTLNIAVGAKPAAGSDLYEICGGSIIPVTGLPSGGTWSQASANASGATVGATSSGVANISFANLISGTYTFVYTTPFGCTDTMTISTKPKPNAGSDVYMECGTPRLFDTLRATPNGGIWTALSSNTNSVTLNTTDTSGRARINLPVAPVQGIWSFIYTAPNGCTDTMSYTIGVTGTPAPAINSGTNPICGNSTVQICPTQFGWSNYQWYKNGVAVSGIAGTQSCITIDTSKVGSYTLAGTNGSACWSKQSPAVVVSLAGAVTPTITVQGGSTTACNNGSITLISSSVNNNQWNKDGVAISGATSQYYNATTSGVYTVTATNCGYTRTSAGTTITVIAPINIGSIQASSGSVCTGSTLSLSNAASGGVWSSSNPSKATINPSTGLVSGISAGSTLITYTINISGCSNSTTYSLNVIDGSNISAPTITVQGSTLLCGTSTVQLCTGTFGWSNYQWYKNGVAVTTGTGTCITVDTSALGSYTLSAATGGGCWSPLSNAVSVSISASLPTTPTVSASGSTTVCNNGTVVLNSSAAANYQWKKDGVTISGATSQSYTASASGVYTVSVSNCAGSSVSAGITVTIVPTITLASIQSSTSSICKTASVTLSNSTTGGVWTSSNTLKATVNATTGAVTGIDTGSVTITYTVTVSGCSKSVTTTLTIVDGSNITAPVIAAQGQASLCGTNTVQICPTTFGWSNYQWYKDGIAVSSNGTSACITADTSKLGSYTLAATNGSGCWSMQSNAVVVSVATTPTVPTISGAGSGTICNGGTITLTSSSSTGNQWNKDGVAISGATSQTYTAASTGVYTVTVTNCGNATSAGTTITIVPHITVNSIQSVTGTVCKNASTTLINTTSGGVWTSNNTSVATVNASTGVLSGVDTGTVTITYTVTVNGCSNAVYATFTIVDGSNIVPPTIIAQSSTTICSGGNVTLCPTSFGWANYQWYKNGVAISQNGYGACITVDTSSLGSYTLTATNGNGCWSAASNAIVVSATAAPTTPTVNASGTTALCSGGSVVLTSSSASGNQWNKNGVAISGATLQTYTATSAGTYTVTVTTCGGNATSASRVVTIASPITVSAITASSNSVCMGTTLTLTDTTIGGVWSSGNDSIATVNASGIVTPLKAGTVVISYTVTVGSCSNVATYSLTVQSGLLTTPTIIAQSSTSLCGAATVQLCPSVYGWSNYQWYKNGVAVTTNGASACIVIDTAKLGSYTLSVTTGTCWSAQSNAIAVTTASAPTTPTISVGGSTSICNGSSVSLTSSSSTGNQWKKDGVVISGATSQTYAATTSGIYTVTVTACGTATSAGTTVTVAAPITVASITSSSSSLCLGNSLTLSCATSGGVWSSSNTAVATINSSNGVVTTVSGGTTTISYTVTVGSCTKSSTYNLTVQGASSLATTPVLDIRGSVNICGSNSLQICPQVWGYSNYQWYKDGIPYSTSACITVNTAGAYTLAGTNGFGCWSAQSAPANVTLNPIPTITATTGVTAICVGSTATLSNSSTIPSGGTGVWTSIAGRATINSATGMITGTSGGTATLVYTVTSSVGCTASTSYNVVVNALPGVPSVSYASGTINPQVGAPGGSYCANRTFTVVGSPSGGVWSKTGVINITSPGGVVTTGNVAGSGSLTYTYTDANGCSNSRTMSGNVYICAARGVSLNNEPLSSGTDFTMYPNPAKSYVNLNIETLFGFGSIVVTDVYGKVVKSQVLSMGSNTVNISNLSKGFYLVSVITSEEKTTKKLIVE